MKTRSICNRCHRIRVVNETRYCAGCVEDLKKMRTRRAPTQEAGELPPVEEKPEP
jgi:hypothetical protein